MVKFFFLVCVREKKSCGDPKYKLETEREEH